MMNRVLFAMVCATVACSSTPPSTGLDASIDASSETAACSCKDSFNVEKSPRGDTVGLEWLAWRYTPTCTFAADTLDIATDATYFGVFADSAGLPGAVRIAQVASTPVPNRVGFRRATFAATTLMAAARPSVTPW